MNRRTKLATGFLAAALVLGAAGTASADPPPWSAAWKKKHGEYCDHDRDRRSTYRPAYDRRGYDPYYAGAGGQCSAIVERINKDRATIRQWQGTGRHSKVVDWSKGDLRNAYRDLDRCRRDPSYDYPYDNVSWPPRYENDDRYYDPDYGRDPYSGRNPYDDPYYGGGNPYLGAIDGSFNLKQDWPLLLGAFLGANVR
jgi:hypothetical protein